MYIMAKYLQNIPWKTKPKSSEPTDVDLEEYRDRSNRKRVQLQGSKTIT